MLTPNNQYPHLSYEVLSDVERIIENQLVDNWVIRIEYTPKITYLTTSWQQWGETFFNITDASGAIDTIISCHMNNPLCAIRMHAEKISPRSCVYFWLCQAGSISEDMKFNPFRIVD